RLWYARKASRNKKSAGTWIGIGVVVYLFSATSVLTHIVEPAWTLLPTDPLIVIASSVLGWVQIKKFNELAASYTLTAHEIGILQNRIGEITSEFDLSEFINDSELAFSREHTQWVARASN
ncbi:SLATT domain-containing protein, partial [Acidiphilium sp. JA12-A1]